MNRRSWKAGPAALVTALLCGACGGAGPPSSSATSPAPWDPTFRLTAYAFDIDFVDESYGWIALRGCRPPAPTPTPPSPASGSRSSPNPPTYPTCQAGVSRTTDGGATWSEPIPVGPPVPSASPDSIASSLQFLNRSDGFLYSYRAAYVTHDGGAHWGDSGLSGDGLKLAGRGQVAWAVAKACGTAESCAYANYEVRRSADGGRTWSAPRGLYGLIQTAVTGVIPFGDKGLVVSTSHSMEITWDSGATWQSKLLPCTSTFSGGIELATFDGHEIWQSCVAFMQAQEATYRVSGIFLSEDGGTTWAEVPVPARMAEGADSSVFIVGSIVALGKGRALVLIFGAYLYLTSDTGLTWNRVGPDATQLGAGCGFLALRFNQPAGAWASGSTRSTSSRTGQSIWISHNADASWSELPPILLGSA